MEYAGDLKSLARKRLRVQLPPGPRKETVMKSIMLCLALVSCESNVQYAGTTLPNGKHAIMLDCAAPAMIGESNGRKLSQCDEDANTLCPFDFHILKRVDYTAKKVHHQSITISCIDPPL